MGYSLHSYDTYGLSFIVMLRQKARAFSKGYYLFILIQIALLIGINVYSRGNHPRGFSSEVFCTVFLIILLITCTSAFRIQVRRYYNFLIFDKGIDPSKMAWCCCDSNPDLPDCCSCCNSCCLYLPINLSRRRFNNSICCDGCCNCCIDCCIECAGESAKPLPPSLSQGDIVNMANHRIIYYPRVTEEKQMPQNTGIGTVIPLQPLVAASDQFVPSVVSAQPVKSVVSMEPMVPMVPMEPIQPIQPIPLVQSVQLVQSVPSTQPLLPSSSTQPPQPVHPLPLPQQPQPVQPNFLPISFPEAHDSPTIPPSLHLDNPKDDSKS